MADTYEKDLAQKSSLTTSDFIRVVGSDNNSYKQGMASVKSALGVTALESYLECTRNGFRLITADGTKISLEYSGGKLYANIYANGAWKGGKVIATW